jgi:DNA-binding HxlR family transcriptional regulator
MANFSPLTALVPLIVRDLLVGPRRSGEFAAGLPRILSNILAARLPPGR